MSPTVKEFLKSANISKSYERISSGLFYGLRCILLNDTATASCCQCKKVIGRLRAIFAFVLYLVSAF